MPLTVWLPGLGKAPTSQAHDDDPLFFIERPALAAVSQRIARGAMRAVAEMSRTYGVVSTTAAPRSEPGYAAVARPLGRRS